MATRHLLPVPATEAERYAAYDELQRKMPGVWGDIRRDRDDECVVVVPSVSLELTSATTGTLMQAMEERALVMLLLLRQPRLRMVYVTSTPVPEEVVGYYLGVLPGVIASHARARLTMVSVGDASVLALSAKLLARPRVLSRIRDLIPNPDRCHLIPYTTTVLERDVALALGIPVYGADPRLAHLGSKSGCRTLFQQVGVRLPAGVEDLRSRDDLADAVCKLTREHPEVAEVIVKINEGVSGSGNALLEVHGLQGDRARAHERLNLMRPESPGVTVPEFLDAFARYGGIVEERITGKRVESPSVQLRVLPDRSVELLSTHDQLLGGATRQHYLGCVFPADPAYSRLISGPAIEIAEHLADLGVIGRFAVDFVVVADEDSQWRAYAIELNLRKGGTTHPFLTLQFLTDGHYDADSGTFLTPSGHEKYLVATDYLENENLRSLMIGDIFDLVARRRMHFDASRQAGVIFHMLSCVTECGRLGMTAIGNTADDAQQLYQQARQALLTDAKAAAVPAIAGAQGPAVSSVSRQQIP